MKLKSIIITWIAVINVLALGCGGFSTPAGERQIVTVRLAAAASLENIFTKRLIPMFNAKHPEIIIQGAYDGSGKLQAQIENGLQADIFISAATKQMDALQKKGYFVEGSVKPLLENKLVLIVPKRSGSKINSFAAIARAKQPAIGEPASVPAGQYAEKVLTKLGIWEQVSSKASFGTNVTQVLQWVAEGSADAGIVYATDAMLLKDKVRVVAEAPAEALDKPVIYPMGLLKKSGKPKEAERFADFLRSAECAVVFEEYGFQPVK